MPKHKLPVMDMRFNTTKRRHKKFEPRVRVWKLKEERTYEEYKSMVGDKVEEEEWKHLDVNEHWHKMKKTMMETAQQICGMSKGPCRHKETWWWNEVVAEAVREKMIKYGKWKRENSKEARMEYKKCRQSAKRVISSANENKQKECASDLNDPEHQNEIFRMAKQMVKERQDITGSNCLKGVSSKVIVNEKGTRMWANAQRDGRPAEYRWRPLFNAAKFGRRPLLECPAVTLPRRETS